RRAVARAQAAAQTARTLSGVARCRAAPVTGALNRLQRMSLRIASVNVNGIRAAYRKGMGDWLAGRGIDILAMQEVRATTEDVQALLGPEWDVLHDPATAKGRAGVAIASRGKASIHRVDL